MPCYLRHILSRGAAALALACAAMPPAGAADAAAPPAQTFGVDVPAGQVDAAIARLDELAKKTMQDTGIPGMAIAVVKGGATAYAKGFGVRKAGEPASVDADTVFQLASLSKPLGATVIAAQVGKGVVAWDTPIVKQLPWFTLSDPWVGDHVTIGDMYAHRSGLPDHAGDDLEALGYSRRQVLERLPLVPLRPFRAGYAYTNFGLTAGAIAAAAAAGKDWETLSQESVYEPLGMASTSSRFADFIQHTNHASGHVKTADGFKPLYSRQPDPQTPAGGASSSANDMAKWMNMVLHNGRYGGKQIISAKALLPALVPQIPMGMPGSVSARTSFYGYGFIVDTQASGRIVLSHSGAFEAGAATSLLMIPSLDLGIIVLSNAIPVGAVEALSMEFADLAQYGRITRDWRSLYAQAMAGIMAPFGTLAGQKAPAYSQPPLKPEAYAGTYFNEYYGSVHAAVRDGKLVLTIGPAKTSFTLTHWDGNRYVFAIGPPNAPEGSRSTVDFSADDAGLVQGMQVEFLDTSGMGRFVRR